LKDTRVSGVRESFSPPKTIHVYNIKKDASAIKYRSDGTGRDSYVIDGSGGLISEFNSTAGFKLGNILRKYNKLPNRPIKVNTMYITKKELFHLRDSKKHENNLINRLYYQEKPKFVKSKEDPEKAKSDKMILTKMRKETSLDRNREMDVKYLTTSIEKIVNYENKKRVKLLRPIEKTNTNYDGFLKTIS